MDIQKKKPAVLVLLFWRQMCGQGTADSRAPLDCFLPLSVPQVTGMV